jgi:hypothetical protein
MHAAFPACFELGGISIAQVLSNVKQQERRRSGRLRTGQRQLRV